MAVCRRTYLLLLEYIQWLIETLAVQEDALYAWAIPQLGSGSNSAPLEPDSGSDTAPPEQGSGSDTPAPEQGSGSDTPPPTPAVPRESSREIPVTPSPAQVSPASPTPEAQRSSSSSSSISPEASSPLAPAKKVILEDDLWLTAPELQRIYALADIEVRYLCSIVQPIWITRRRRFADGERPERIEACHPYPPYRALAEFVPLPVSRVWSRDMYSK
jgi:hypothetical protein